MKIVTIEPVAKPKSFADVKFTEKDYDAANKAGPLVVSYGTAMENIRNSKGLYRIKPEPSQVQEVAFVGVKEPEDMTKAELVKELISWGKKPHKQMTKKKCAEFITKLRAEAAEMLLDDDEGDEGQGDE